MSVNCKPKLSDEMKTSLNAFQNELDVLSAYWESPKRAIEIANKHLELNPDLEFINGWGTPLGVLEELAVKQEKSTIKEKGARGGKRDGAGRKKKEPTVVMRVPESLKAVFEEMIKKHKEESE
ncbi:hypothetical protein HJ019_23505 [Vibrio parahaemolyticus]|nr:hypothetical protein [Vibrio parahaemolyticus]